MPKEKPKRIRKTLDLPEPLSLEVDAYERKYHHSTNAQALIQLIHLGLQFSEKIENVSLHPIYDDANDA